MQQRPSSSALACSGPPDALGSFRPEPDPISGSVCDGEVDYCLLFEQSPQPAWIFDAETLQFLQVNEAAIEQYGYSREEFLGMTVKDIRPTEEIHGPPVSSAETESLERARRRPFRHRKKSGEIIDVEVSFSACRHRGRAARFLVAHDISEHKQLENALRERDQDLRITAEAAGLGTWWCDPETGEIKGDERTRALFNFVQGQIVTYDGFLQALHPDDRQATDEAVRRCLATGDQYAVEYRVPLPDGTLRWLLTRGRPIRCSAGKIERIMGVTLDITERKESERRLRESEERFRKVLENAPIPVLVHTTAEEILYMSKAVTRLTGWSPEELRTGRDWMRKVRRIPEDQVESMLDRVRRSFTRGHPPRPVEITVWTKRGTPRSWLFHGGHAFVDSAGRTFVTSMAIDVTDRKHTETALRDLSEASRLLMSTFNPEEAFDRIADLLVPSYADWCAVYLPHAHGIQSDVIAFIALRHTAEHLRGTLEQHVRRYSAGPIADVMTTGKAVLLRTAQPVLGSGSKGAGASEFSDRSVILAPVRAHAEIFGVLIIALCEPTVHPDGQYRTGEFIFAEELAYRAALALENAGLYRKAEAALTELQEADRRKDEFLAMLSHELRNPMAPIRNAVAVLQHGGLSKSRLDWAHDLIDRQVGHLTRMVDDLLDVSRVTQGKITLRIEPVPVKGIVERAVEMSRPFIDAKKHNVSVTLPAQVVAVEGDAIRLTQVVANLLNNASKYTDEGGAIRVSVEIEDGRVAIRVSDNGIGIAPDVLPHIFGLFTQADGTLERAQGGLGIGLTLAQKLVEMHGGTIDAFSSGRGKGSEFTVRLPLLPQEMGNAPMVMEQEKIEGSPLRILIVDDNADATESMTVLLEMEGHETAFALSGPAALEVAKTFKPDMVLLDIGLPGMDGFEVGRLMRQMPETKHIFLVALTGYGGDAAKQEAVDAGFDHYLVKPVALQALLDVVETVRSTRRPDA